LNTGSHKYVFFQEQNVFFSQIYASSKTNKLFDIFHSWISMGNIFCVQISRVQIKSNLGIFTNQPFKADQSTPQRFLYRPCHDQSFGATKRIPIPSLK
jgi:hypothetical protein